MRKKVEQALRESENATRSPSRLQRRAVGLGLPDRPDLLLSSLEDMLGLKEHEVGNDPEAWFSRVHPEDLDRVSGDCGSPRRWGAHLESEHRMRPGDGGYRWMLVRGHRSTGRAGIAYRMAGSQTDISDRKLYEDNCSRRSRRAHGAAESIAFHGPAGACSVASPPAPEEIFSVLFLDLDRFKVVNDSLGHLLGDRLLVEFARRMERCVRPGDTVARLGGDEFTILLDDLRDQEEASRLPSRSRPSWPIRSTSRGKMFTPR